MIQGTASSVGKSLLTAGLCRILREDGYRVAPFKSQNMALNSFVTADGLEMGRAQAVQAQCAGIAPDVRMNPILLKPTGENGSQVVVKGEVLGDMTAREYYACKHELLRPVMEAYHGLAAEYDVILLEGAGSPAEINLREGDFVNMGMAKLASAPVLLCGDIDRGGVFAALAGTMLLLREEERAFVKGVLINKFRGERAILEPGLRMLEEIVARPVLGVVPYLRLDVDEEDSLSGRLAANAPPGLVDIAVIRLPRLSNFTDFAPLAAEGVSLRYVGSARDFGSPDLVILPGTKNTMDDLCWLRESGLAEKVLAHAAGGGALLGICGGYQMMGSALRDPLCLERGGEMRGLGLFAGETVFAPQKTRAQVAGRFGRVGGVFAELSGMEVRGYKLHMGETRAPEPVVPLCELYTGEGIRPDGAARGNLYGSYLHGLFDGEGVARTVLQALFRSKGLEPGDIPATGRDRYLEGQYSLLAKELRKSLRMDAIYAIIETGIQ